MFKREFAFIYAVLVPVFLTWGILVTTVHASEIREIELVDGSVIAGEIISLSNGFYTVKSASIGTMQIPKSNIRTIRSRRSPGSPGTSGDRVSSLEEKMMSDGDIMGVIQALQSDPDVQEILRDPEIMNAVKAGNVSVLMANPKYIKLSNKHAMQQIQNKIPQ